MWLNSVENRAILAFRGTVTFTTTTLKVSLTNWIADFKFDRKKCRLGDPAIDCGEVHDGFQTDYIAVQGQIHQALKALPLTLTLDITGHSLGGALSTLAFYDIQYYFKFHKISLTNYGAPAVGDSTFYNAYQKALLLSNAVMMRYVRRQLDDRSDVLQVDVVSIITDDFGYYHITSPTFLESPTKFKLNMPDIRALHNYDGYWADAKSLRE